jgi:methylenetetrahydrofolate reductase (NADPH)
VTYGAGGGTKDLTVEIAKEVKREYKVEVLAHLTCVGSTRQSIDDILLSLENNNIQNVLALRGDLPANSVLGSEDMEFSYAYELVEYIRKRGGFCIGGACYPEGHVESKDKVKDLLYLKHKIDMGLDFLITQLFFDNELFYSFLEKLALLEVKLPVIAGILPVLNVNQIKRIQELSGCSLPKKFIRILDRYQDNPKALAEAGIAYAAEQIVDLLSYGVDGIHIYTMNKPDAAQDILKSIGNIRESLISRQHHESC